MKRGSFIASTAAAAVMAASPIPAPSTQVVNGYESYFRKALGEYTMGADALPLSIVYREREPLCRMGQYKSFGYEVRVGERVWPGSVMVDTLKDPGEVEASSIAAATVLGFYCKYTLAMIPRFQD